MAKKEFIRISASEIADMTENQKRQIYRQYQKTANRRLKRMRVYQREAYGVDGKDKNMRHASKRLDEFLAYRGKRYLPEEKSLKSGELDKYISEALLYLTNRTSTISGTKEMIRERRKKFGIPDEWGNTLVTSGTADELDKALNSDEWELMKLNVDYHILLEDFSNEMAADRNVIDLLKDWREFINSKDMSYNEMIALRKYRKENNENITWNEFKNTQRKRKNNV